MESAATTAVEPADRSTVEAATGVAAKSAGVAMKSTTDESAGVTECAAAVDSASTVNRPTVVASAAVITASAVVAVSAPIAPAIIAVAASVVTASEVAATEPGTSAYEDAADEPIRAVIAIGRAIVRSITVIAISADRCRAVPVSIAVSGVSRNTHSDADRHPLRVRITRAEQRNRQKQSRYTSKPEVFHSRTPFRVPTTSVKSTSCGVGLMLT